MSLKTFGQYYKYFFIQFVFFSVKSPGTLVVSTYAPCPDVRKHVTPDLKAGSLNEKCSLVWVNLSNGKFRSGGSSLAQCFGQLGDSCPDLDDPIKLKHAFNITQGLINGKYKNVCLN